MAEHIASMGAHLMTAEELLRSDVPNKSTELVRGVLVVREPPGTWHGQLAAKLLFLLGQHVYPRNAGMLFGQDTGFLVARDPDSVRAADVSFVRAENTWKVGKRGYASMAPDLTVEILTPGENHREVRDKVADWLRAGTRVVWVIDPEREIATVYRANGTQAIVSKDGFLDGEDVLPGFSCSLETLFG